MTPFIIINSNIYFSRLMVTMTFFLTMVPTTIHMVTMELNPIMTLDPMVPVDIITMVLTINTETVDTENMDTLILGMAAMVKEATVQDMEVTVQDMEATGLEVVILLVMELDLTQLFMV